MAHVPRRSADPLRLPGSNREGALALDGGSAADVAAEVLADLPGVRSASGRMIHERGQLIAVMDVTATRRAQRSARRARERVLAARFTAALEERTQLAELAGAIERLERRSP